MAGLATVTALTALPQTAAALTADGAKTLVDKTVADINSIINSGKSESAMLKDFEKLFASYADVPAIDQVHFAARGRGALHDGLVRGGKDLFVEPQHGGVMGVHVISGNHGGVRCIGHRQFSLKVCFGCSETGR